MKKAITSLLFLVIICFAFYAEENKVSVYASKNRVIKDVYVLASDSFRGRKFPDVGREKAAAYIAGQFNKADLKAIHEGEEPYFQKIPVSRLERGRTVIYTNDDVYRSGNSFSFAATEALDDSLSIPVKFIGYSSAEEIGYTGRDTLIFFLAHDMVDAHNRLDALIEETGARLFGFSIMEESSIFPSFRTGEASNIIFNERLNTGYQYPKTAFGMGAAREQDWLYDYLPVKNDDFGVFLFNKLLVEKFFGESLEKIHKDARRSFRKGIMTEPVDKHLTFVSNFELTKAYKFDDNVIGYIEGSDLKDEVLIICGHYDHLGKRGKEIYYGADDNASGTAAVMELARMFRQAKNSGMEFRRSIVFIAFGAEETGLNGSSYYVANPVFPLEKTVLVINLDMVGRADQIENQPGYATVQPMVRHRRPVWRAFRRVDRSIDNIVLNRAGLSLSSLMFYAGSDHFPFIREGVPAVVVNTGMHDDYHEPTDTPDKINYDNLINIVRIVFAVAAKVANEPERFPVE